MQKQLQCFQFPPIWHTSNFNPPKREMMMKKRKRSKRTTGRDLCFALLFQENIKFLRIIIY